MLLENVLHRTKDSENIAQDTTIIKENTGINYIASKTIFFTKIISGINHEHRREKSREKTASQPFYQRKFRYEISIISNSVGKFVNMSSCLRF